MERVNQLGLLDRSVSVAKLDHRPRENIDGCTEEGVYYGNSASGDFTQANADNVSFPSGTSGSDYPIEVFRRDYFYDTPSGQQDASARPT